MELQNRYSDLKAAGLTVVGVSVDSPSDNMKLSAKLKLTDIKLLSDTHVKGQASKALGMWKARQKISALGSVIVSNGKVIYRTFGKKSVGTLLKAAK